MIDQIVDLIPDGPTIVGVVPWSIHMIGAVGVLIIILVGDLSWDLGGLVTRLAFQTFDITETMVRTRGKVSSNLI